MSEKLVFSLSLGKGKTGLILKAQLVDEDGVDSGSEITTGFQEIGEGYYVWTHNVSNDFYGGAKFIDSGTDDLLGFISINPNKLSPSGMDNVMVESNVNMREAMSIIAAVLGGVLETPSAAEVVIKAIRNPDITRVQSQVNSSGERISVTLNLPT